MGGTNPVGEGQCMVESSQPGEDRHPEGNGLVRREQSQRGGGPLSRGGGTSGPRSWRNERSGGLLVSKGKARVDSPLGLQDLISPGEVSNRWGMVDQMGEGLRGVVEIVGVHGGWSE